MAELAGWLLLAAWIAVTLVRVGLAVRAWRPPALADEPEVVVLQPILSGDPHLAGQLAANLAHHPAARFRWLVDSADTEGLRVARELAASAGTRVQVREFPPCPDATNPKVFKLARAVEPGDRLLAVLDDDTVLPQGALARAATALRDGDLVTGLPHYLSEGSVWSRLVAAFVNGNALLTYPPLAALARPVTINGMFYLTTADALARAGGFGAIEHLVCDDYELALAFRAAGLRLVQAAIPVTLRTTVAGPLAYLHLMRRWQVFAGRLLRAEAGAALLLLVVVPTVLPVVVLALAGGAGAPSLALAMVVALAAKAVVTAALRRRLLGAPAGVAAVPLEVVADLLQPVHAVLALARPGRFTWRGRPMVLDRSGGIRP